MTALRLTVLALSLPSPGLARDWSPRTDWRGQDASQVTSHLPTTERRLSDFRFTWDANKEQFIVQSAGSSKVIWESRPGYAFVLAGRGKGTWSQWRGSFTIRDAPDSVKCRVQSIDYMEIVNKELQIRGFLTGPNCLVPYTMQFQWISAERLRFQVQVLADGVNRVFMNYQSRPDERFFGFGEQFTYFDLKGRTVPILTTEQGHTRGLQPYSFALNKISQGAAGNWATTYAPLPFYMTSHMHSLFLENSEYSAFDLENKDMVEIRVWSSQLTGQILAGSTPLDLLESFTEYAGRLPKVPRWFHEGAIIGLMGGEPFIRSIWERLQAENTPIAGIWIQDWQGKRVTPYGIRMWWNWEVDENTYPDWQELVQDLEREGIATLGYVNPFLSDVSSKPNLKRNLFLEAKDRGFLVKRPDGSPYEIDSGGFTGTLVDLTNPAAFDWYKKVLVSSLFRSGMKGWMADFGEALPFDAKLHEGTASVVHNLYPELWARLNREAIREAGMEGEAVAFLRAGSLRSSRYAPLYWLGDQMTTWDEHDGIKSAITGLLSGGLSGMSVNHMDIGGLISMQRKLGNWSFVNFYRTKELLQRGAELSAFTSIYRNHEGNNPGSSHQFYSDDETLAFFSKFAKVFALLTDYREHLFEEAHRKGYPVARALFLHYPDDPETINTHYQWLLGSEFLIAPVVDPGHTSRLVYFPKGEWVHVWSGKTYGGLNSGVWATVPAPIGEPPVFHKKGSAVGERFRFQLLQLP